MENRPLRNRNVEVEIRDQPYGRRIPTGNARGRPRKTYDQKTSRNSRMNDIRDTCATLQAVPVGQAHEAILKILRDSEMVEEERVIKKILSGTWNAKDITQRMKNCTPPPEKLKPVDGLQMLLDCSLSKDHYNMIHKHVNDGCGVKILPSYYSVANAKQECRPLRGMHITETCAEVELQALLDCTLNRIVEMVSHAVDLIFDAKNVSVQKCKFICSYGLDSSTGQRLYHQKFTDEEEMNHEDRPDNSLLFVSLIPLKLISDDRSVLWENPSPCSTRLVRPIMLKWVQETAAEVLDITSSLEDEIQSLTELRATTSNGNLVIAEPCLYLTLIDGKVMNHLTRTSNHRCPICGVKRRASQDMRNINSALFRPLPNALNYGISPLHCFINFMVHLLHLSYRLEIGVWIIKTAQHKQMYRAKKKRVQRQLYEQIGIKVDYPNPNGMGNSNNGNCARRAFEDTNLFADILGLDRDLVSGLKVVLTCISSRYRINEEAFKLYCERLINLYVQKYEWYPLSPTLHKVLVHGHEIARNLPLPLGCFSEQASESKHKVHKKTRIDHARKTSRLSNLTDVFLRSMDLSDPILSSKAIEKASGFQHFYQLMPEARELLVLDENDATAVVGDVLLANALDNIEIENEAEEE